jgi:hypothetical protein
VIQTIVFLIAYANAALTSSNTTGERLSMCSCVVPTLITASDDMAEVLEAIRLERELTKIFWEMPTDITLNIGWYR